MNVLFDAQEGKLAEGVKIVNTVEHAGLKFCYAETGLVVFKDGEFLFEDSNVRWAGPTEMTIVKDGKEETILAKAVHYSEDCHDEFKFIIPVDGGIIIVHAKDNTYISTLPFEYVHHKGYHLVAQKPKGNSTRQALINIYWLIENNGQVDDKVFKLGFLYHKIRLGRRTIGVLQSKCGHMTYYDMKLRGLDKVLIGAANSLAEAIEEAPELGSRLLVVPSAEFEGANALFDCCSRQIVLDNLKTVDNQEHYFLAVSMDGTVKAYNSRIQELDRPATDNERRSGVCI